MNKARLFFEPVDLIVYRFDLKQWFGCGPEIEAVEMTVDLCVRVWESVNGEHMHVMTADGPTMSIFIGSDSQDKFDRFFSKMQSYTDSFNREFFSGRNN